MYLTPTTIDVLIEQALKLMKTDNQQAFEMGMLIQQQSTAIRPVYLKGEGGGLFIQGIVHFYRAEYDIAATLLNRALQRFREIEDKEWQARVLTPLGATYKQMANFPAALEIHHQQLDFSRSHDDRMSEMRALNGIATVYHQLKDYHQALEYLAQARTLAQQLKDRPAEAVILGNICDEYLSLGRYTEALDAGLNSLDLFKDVTLNPAEFINTLLNVGMTYRRMGDFELAETYLKNAREMAEQNRLDQFYLVAMREIGELHLRRGQRELARICLHEAIARAKATGAEKSIFSSYYTLAELYKKESKFETALYYLEQYYTLKEAIFNVENDKRIKALEYHYRAEAARKETDLYRERMGEQERLREQEKQMYQSLTELKNEFIRSATHDLKNPISAIKLLLHLIEKHEHITDERGKQLWTRLTQQIDIIQTLVSDLLDYARLETGQALNVTPEELHPTMTKLLADAQTMAESRGIELTLYNQLANDIVIPYDSSRLSQALRGLLNYILKRMPEREKLTIELTQRDNTIVTRLLAGGWFIDKDDLDGLFKPFFRAQSFDDKPTQGSGLGLALVQVIIEQHSGQITVQSHRDTGTRFQIVLPTNAIQMVG